LSRTDGGDGGSKPTPTPKPSSRTRASERRSRHLSEHEPERARSRRRRRRRRRASPLVIRRRPRSGREGGPLLRGSRPSPRGSLAAARRRRYRKGGGGGRKRIAIWYVRRCCGSFSTDFVSLQRAVRPCAPFPPFLASDDDLFIISRQAARILANLVVAGGAVVGRAMLQAYRRAIVSECSLPSPCVYADCNLPVIRKDLSANSFGLGLWWYRLTNEFQSRFAPSVLCCPPGF
jgi:hypothetical protein